jgi:hypothetical protein
VDKKRLQIYWGNWRGLKVGLSERRQSSKVFLAEHAEKDEVNTLRTPRLCGACFDIVSSQAAFQENQLSRLNNHKNE